MAGYPVFQPQGPNIDIRLFGDAAQAGAKLGAEIPSALTSIVSGAEQGIDFASKLQEREAQTRNTQAEAQINELKLKEAQDTETEQIQATKADLLADTEKKTNLAALETQKADFYQELNEADPTQRAKLVLGNKYAQLFAADKNLFNQQLENVYFDSNNGVDAATRGRVGQALKIGKESAYRDHLAAQNEDKLIASTTALYDEPVVQAAAEKLNITPEQVPYKMQLVEHGKYETADGNLIPDIEAGGGWKLKKGYSPELSKNSWDAIDPATGTVIDDTGSINDKTRHALSLYKQNVATVGGQYKLRGLEEVSKTPANDKSNISGQQVDVPTFGKEESFKREAFPSSEDLHPADRIADDLSKSLKVDPKYLKETARPTLESLYSHITDYIKNPLSRGNAETLRDYNTTVNTLAKSITNNQFENSEGLRAQYTDSHVEAYNKTLSSSIGGSEGSQIGDIFNIFKASSPEDLYYIKQSPIIESVINKYVNRAIVMAEKQQQTIIQGQKASKATISFLSGVAGGSGS